ncbi:hypothetical protein [Tengunoibacter tsumagoiensis]|uniref:Uncharacterized protein n=1 Tax=Tengunoibacter tsumagoiensis TaxID=2014871 RepID=A0A402A818_9CHLR|nr:hypothetical protein [Tengunoibacter tsumagoiensis]GCE15146.1 hypothetical protein KTT_50050 [Tengunoibacter tsumagoiensis]
MNMNQRWIQRPVEELFRETVESWPRNFALVIEDLLILPGENVIVAGGAEGNFFPQCVAPYLSSPQQAIWFVPTDTLCDQERRSKQTELSKRQKRHGVYNESSDTDQSLCNIIARN